MKKKQSRPNKNKFKDVQKKKKIKTYKTVNNMEDKQSVGKR